MSGSPRGRTPCGLPSITRLATKLGQSVVEAARSSSRVTSTPSAIAVLMHGGEYVLSGVMPVPPSPRIETVAGFSLPIYPRSRSLHRARAVRHHVLPNPHGFERGLKQAVLPTHAPSLQAARASVGRTPSALGGRLCAARACCEQAPSRSRGRRATKPRRRRSRGPGTRRALEGSGRRSPPARGAGANTRPRRSLRPPQFGSRRAGPQGPLLVSRTPEAGASRVPAPDRVGLCCPLLPFSHRGPGAPRRWPSST